MSSIHYSFLIDIAVKTSTIIDQFLPWITLIGSTHFSIGLSSGEEWAVNTGTIYMKQLCGFTLIWLALTIELACCVLDAFTTFSIRSEYLVYFITINILDLFGLNKVVPINSCSNQGQKQNEGENTTAFDSSLILLFR